MCINFSNFLFKFQQWNDNETFSMLLDGSRKTTRVPISAYCDKLFNFYKLVLKKGNKSISKLGNNFSVSSILRLCIFIFDTFILNYGRIWLKLDVWFARILATHTSVCVASMRANQTSNFNNSVMKLWFFVYVWEKYEISSLTTWYVVHTRAWFFERWLDLTHWLS